MNVGKAVKYKLSYQKDIIAYEKALNSFAQEIKYHIIEELRYEYRIRFGYSRTTVKDACDYRDMISNESINVKYSISNKLYSYLIARDLWATKNTIKTYVSLGSRHRTIGRNCITFTVGITVPYLDNVFKKEIIIYESEII